MVEMNKKIELLDSILDQLSRLSFGDKGGVDALKKRTGMILCQLGVRSSYINLLDRIRFFPLSYYSQTIERDKQSSWTEATTKLKNLIDTIKEELELFGDATSSATTKAAQPDTSSIFIVHGHDQELKQAVARTVKKLDFKAVILHEQPNNGRTSIEKFEDYSNVGFAIVLLSADDIARSAKPGEEEKYRARQNVILELGFFLGRLGRERVVAIHKKHENFEMPSDYSGVLFIPYSDGWELKVIQELKACGYTVDANALL